ncbi:hypothetical protein MATL_G00203490 [Megalops atlanticus]|uniref:Centrosomal protein 57kDa-like protein 1 n=1 Tax=Megalops atlanticus TaxID=7932 RepID=A0A9D3PLY0_MEGAT|nr:hypothetical protein MATL_G00203490 [Megalops atlanticus]
MDSTQFSYEVQHVKNAVRVCLGYLGGMTVSATALTAVIAALKTLQEKMRRLELERVQAESSMKQLMRAADRNTAATERQQRRKETPVKEGKPNKDLVSQLESAEARCSLLEKQLDYMKKMLETAQRDGNSAIQKQVYLQKERLKDQTGVITQLEKLEKLEKEYLKLSSTQSVAQKKIELLEQKLREEEHERKLVQEKAAELQRGLERNRALYSSASAGVKQKKKTKTPVRKTAVVAPAHVTNPKAKQMPFVAGMSTGRSHSVSANVQSVLHMMKHHHPQLCDPVRSLRRPGSETRRGARRALSSSQPDPALDSLSELLLALQDELGQMSFEHQELVKQIEETRKQKLKEDLERELDCLVKRMEEKGAQISQLRRHQLMVQKLTQNSQSPKQRAASADGRISRVSCGKSLPSSPVQKTPQGPKSKGNQGNRQPPKGAVRLQTNLKKDDIMWET